MVFPGVLSAPVHNVRFQRLFESEIVGGHCDRAFGLVAGSSGVVFTHVNVPIQPDEFQLFFFSFSCLWSPKTVVLYFFTISIETSTILCGLFSSFKKINDQILLQICLDPICMNLNLDFS